MSAEPFQANSSPVTFCSTISQASGEDPAGSAWAIRRYLMVELPLPWSSNSLRSRSAPEGLEEFIVEAYGNVPEPWGFVGIAPDPGYSVPGMTRIIDLRQGPELAKAYHRDTYLVPAAHAVDYMRLLGYEPQHPDLLATRQPDDQSTREFFVCTHGAVDICCATIGYPMYQLLRAMAERSEPPVRVWRCTHFGGHRFAATALEAPQGRYWGHLKADMLAKLIHRKAPVHEIRRHYRGWAALAEEIWQVAEAEVFAVAGWNWCGAVITGVSDQTTPGDGGIITFSFTLPSRDAGEVDVEITPTGSVRTMDASRTDELRDAPQYAARILAQRPPACLDHVR